MNQTLRWYNKLSIVHDLLSFRDWPYSQARKYAINALELQKGDTVVDLFCGTGVNFDLVIPQIGRAGRLIGVDGSPGMLARARWRVRRNRWDRNQIDLVEQDLLQADPGFLAGLLPGRCVPKVLITLALGIFADYEDIFGSVFAAMPVGTRFAIMEFYCTEQDRGQQLVNFIGDGDCRRRVWEPLKAVASECREERYSPRFRFVQGSLVVASGVK